MARRPRCGKIGLTVIARSAATKQSSLRGAMDCFASLAMTVKQQLLAAETSGW
jgi:hypothetical protein